MGREVIDLERIFVLGAPVLVVLVEPADRTLLDGLGSLLATVLMGLALVLGRGVGTEVFRAAGPDPAAVGRARTEPAGTGWGAIAARPAGRPRADVAARARTAEPGGAWGAGRTILARPRLADRQAAALERLLVEPLDRLLGNRAIRVIHEGEAAGAACLAVHGQDDRRRDADARQMLTQICLRRRVRQITDEQAD